MQTLFVTLISFVLLVQTAGAPGRVVNLVLPRSWCADQAAAVELKLGVIQRGADVEVETTSGKMLGVISPYGIRSGSEAGTYTVPLPPAAISNKRVSLRITLNQHSRGKRAPNAKEVQSVRLKITSTVR